MRILKKILIALAIIIAIPFILALFISKNYSVERQITINKPQREVFNFVKLLKNQDYYNKWVMADPNMKKDFRGTDGTVGFVYAWDGNDNAGKGEQKIKTVTENSIETELLFIKPFEGQAKTHMLVEPVSATQTTIKWGMAGESKYPMNFMNLFMDNMLGKDLQTSLTALKNNLENQ